MPMGLEQIDPKKNADYFRTMMEAEVDAVSVIGAMKEDPSDFQLVDVRDEESYRKGHVKGAMSLPLAEISKRLDELDKDMGVLVYCYDPPCMASVKAAHILSREGFKVKDVGGGFENFEKNGAAIEKGAEAIAR